MLPKIVLFDFHVQVHFVLLLLCLYFDHVLVPNSCFYGGFGCVC